MVMSFASRSASRMINSNALRRISPRSRGFLAAQAGKAVLAASMAALASSTVALATEATLFSVAGSITSKRAPSDALRHWPPIHRSVGTLARRLSYIAMVSSIPCRFHSLIPAPAGIRQFRAKRPGPRFREDEWKYLTLQRTAHPLGDPIDARQRQIFQNIRRRQRNVRRGDAYRRAVEIVERFVGGDGDDLRAPATQPRVLFHGEQPVGARHRAKNGLGVERHQ